MKISRGPKLDKKLKNSGVIVEADFKYMFQNPNGDAGFDPEHNQRVIADTIKKTKARERQLKKQYMERVEERVDAGMSFLKALSEGKYATSTPNEAAMKYFGRQELGRLRGIEIRERLMESMRKMVN